MLNFPFVDSYILLLIVLGATFILFVLNKVRYDFVALGALVTLVFLGIIPSEEMFSGFADTAVITIVGIFVFSKGLVNSGLIDYISNKVLGLSKKPGIELFILMVLTVLLSGFINNIAAISLMVPIALRIAKTHKMAPSIFLLPLAFSSLLGGLSTSIGTPANIIISAERAKIVGEPFSLFDFAFVGYPLAILGVLFSLFIGWHLLPKRRKGGLENELFEIKDYVAEVMISPESLCADKNLYSTKSPTAKNIHILKLIRDDETVESPSQYEILRVGDILLLQSDSEMLETFLDEMKLQLIGTKAISEELLTVDDEIETMEVVVEHNSSVIGKSFRELDIRSVYGINLLAVARENETIYTRLADTIFKAGDVLLLRGKADTLSEAIKSLGVLPLRAHDLHIGEPKQIVLALFITVGVILSSSLLLVPVHLAFILAVMTMVMTGILRIQQVYNAIEWKIVVLIGSLITIGHAFEATGSANYVAHILLENLENLSPLLIIGSMLLLVTLISNTVDGVAVAVVFAPIAILLAAGLDASPDPFLMAVSIGASTGLLTPFGAQPNALVMTPGGYKFSDYTKAGGLLSIIIVLVATPLILYFWPLY
jgi:di/tricarboxylate transporter